eukprot:Colp12_sorted_trinity150504_noHs@10392
MWKKISSENAPAPRSSHCLVGLGDKFLLLGGEDTPRHPFDASVHSYSPKNGWVLEPLKEGSIVPEPNLGFCAVTVDDAVYVFGGRDVDSVDLSSFYKFQNNEWTVPEVLSGTLPQARSYHAMAAVQSRVYVFGGCTKDGRNNDLHVYDTVKKTWTEVSTNKAPNAPHGRGGASLVAVHKEDGSGDLIYVIFGFNGQELGDVHVFDTSSKTWKEIECSGNKPSPRSVCAAVLLPNNKAFVFGGERDPSDLGHLGAGLFHQDVCLLDLKTHEWTILPNTSETPSERGWFPAGILADGTVGIFGGLSSSNDRLGDFYLWSQ